MKFHSKGLLPSLALACLPLAAAAQDDPHGIVTVQIENDAFSLPGTDHYYTSGARFGYVTPTGAVPGWLAGYGTALMGRGTQRMEFDVQQVIYTPVDTQLYDPNIHDRPYAGELTLRSALQVDGDDVRSVAGVSLGVVGPAALGQSVQNSFHDLIGDSTNKGWHYQLRTEPTLDFFSSRIWRLDVAQFGPGVVQVLPSVSGQVGNSEIYAQAGGLVRYGQGLDSDYGPAIIQPGFSGGDAYTPTRPLVWYVFAGAVGRVVAHDLLVQGNDFVKSRGVPLTPLQADAEIGGAVEVWGWRVTATEVLTSPEFHHAAPAFQYGSLAFSKRF